MPTPKPPEAYLEVQRRIRSQPANAPAPVRVDSAMHNSSQVLISEWKDGAIEITFDVPRPACQWPRELLFGKFATVRSIKGRRSPSRTDVRPRLMSSAASGTTNAS
jgi:hypothetical protein